ncbi:ABC transporter permease [Clostridium sp. NSJ-145]|uniref:ABC transporter permease n=1 Tax=Clostridium sp. NSJ-145 TaxID=2897777 RepID=UPI001E45835C|nr:ABC transporter permease [Clostridium sp. NSJ-145]MCD2500946.1 ABC transporter permease [Clostridium sp. NSJ-145]
MKSQLKQIFHDKKFLLGFTIFITILFVTIVYPILVFYDPLEMVGGLFYKPGNYVSITDVVESKSYKLNIDTKAGRLESKLSLEDRAEMATWLEKFGGVSISEIDVTNAEELVKLWNKYYDSNNSQEGLISAKKKYYVRLDNKIDGILEESEIVISTVDEENGELVEGTKVNSKDFVNVKDISNQRTFVLGTDNFGRDVLTELVYATRTSLKIGLIAGLIATLIGLMLGLLSGYVGGLLDDIIMFITNLFTVIPSFVILILISYSVGQSARGITMVASIIGLTSWTWTTRSVRSQVISLRNRDHVNLSKLSGHSLFRIILTDILPYVASYVIMALILQISSGILAEAQLSMLGLGPATTKVTTLGLMMNWAMQYKAPLSNAWWAFLPVILSIALITFSLNLMNTGLDKVFNPQLRE